MPKKKNRDASILGKLSALKRSGELNWRVLGFTEPQIKAASVAFAKLGAKFSGSKGGFARAAKLDAETRRSIAIKAIETRWKRRADAEVNRI